MIEIVMSVLAFIVLIFIGVCIYGIINDHKQKKNGVSFTYSKSFWIGLVGANVCNLLLQVVKLIFWKG